MYFLLFHYCLTLEMEWTLHRNTLESPSPKDALKFVSSLAEIGSLLLEKIFKMLRCIFAIHYYFTFEDGVILHLNKLAIEPCKPKDELCKVVLEK